MPAAEAPPLITSAADFPEGLDFRWVNALWAIFIVALGAFSLRIASPATIFYSALTLALFFLPGLLIAPVFLGGDRDTLTARAIFGASFGVAMSGYVAVVTGFLAGWSPKLIVIAILSLSCVCAVLAHAFKGRFVVPMRRWTAADSAILAGIGTVLVLFTASPAMHVGKLTSRGYAYTWLYGLDFVARADFALAMTSKLPPDFYWMSGVPLRLYLVGYAGPAFAFSASGRTIDLHAALILMSLAFGFLMLACLYLFLRSIFSETKVLISSMFICLLGYSYYWIYDAAKAPLIRPGHRFDFHDSVSHLFQRVCLVEPQAAMATSLLLTVLTFLTLTGCRLKSYALAVFLGVCLGLSFGSDAMQGIVVIAWFGLLFSIRVLFVRGSLREEFFPFFAAVAATGAVCASYFGIGMYQRSSSHLVSFDFNTWMVRYGLFFFLAEFGPLIILGVWGAIRWWRQSREPFAWAPLLLGIVAMLPVMFLKQSTTPRPRMADRLLPITLIVFAAYLLRELFSARGGRATRVWVFALVLLAVPTFFTDMYYTSNVEDLYNTRYVLAEDMQACDWIRHNLPESAVIQGSYNYFIPPDRGLYFSLISSFAQRPQVLGWFSGAATLVDDGWPLAERRREDIEATMSSGSLNSLLNFVQKYSVDYVYVGSVEQRKFKDLLPLLQSAPKEFQPVYSKDGVFLFRHIGKDQSAMALPGSLDR